MEKRAALGKIAQVRAKLMLKGAYEAGFQDGMGKASFGKESGFGGEWLRSLVPGTALGAAAMALPPVLSPLAHAPGAVGTVAGLIKGTPTDDQLSEMNESPNMGFIPGVGAYRGMQRLKSTVKRSGKIHPVISEALGGGTSTLASALAGGTLGAVLGGIGGGVSGTIRNPGLYEEMGSSALDGAGIGAALGAGGGALAGSFANIAGFITGMIRKSRSVKEQLEQDRDGGVMSNYLVPGVSGHNLVQRLRSTSNVKGKGNKKGK